MADVVVEEDLDDVLVSRVQQQQLPRAAALVARLPERVVVPDGVRPAQSSTSGLSQHHSKGTCMAHTPRRSSLHAQCMLELTTFSTAYNRQLTQSPSAESRAQLGACVLIHPEGAHPKTCGLQREG